MLFLEFYKDKYVIVPRGIPVLLDGGTGPVRATDAIDAKMLPPTYISVRSSTIAEVTVEHLEAINYEAEGPTPRLGCAFRKGQGGGDVTSINETYMTSTKSMFDERCVQVEQSDEAIKPSSSTVHGVQPRHTQSLTVSTVFNRLEYTLERDRPILLAAAQSVLNGKFMLKVSRGAHRTTQLVTDAKEVPRLGAATPNGGGGSQFFVTVSLMDLEGAHTPIVIEAELTLVSPT